MRESFVVHAEYIEDLPEEYKITYLQYIYQYGIFDEEPQNLEGFEQSIWIKIKRRIDQDRQAYEERKEKNKKRQEEWRKKQRTDAEEPATEVVAEPSEGVPGICTPSQTEYSKVIFNIFKEAGLPCNKNNEISFLQQDFFNGLSYIHSSTELKRVHSDDIIKACENYVAVLNDPETYVTTKMSFYKLVQSKLFYNLLPANYDKANFISYKKNTTAEKTEPQEKKWFEDKPCSKCGAKKVFWSNDLNSYKCDSCGSVYKLGGF